MLFIIIIIIVIIISAFRCCQVMSIPGARLEQATLACVKELKKRQVKTLLDFRTVLQADGGEKLIELLTETALEVMGNTNSAPARPLAVSMWQLRKRDDDLVACPGHVSRVSRVWHCRPGWRRIS